MKRGGTIGYASFSWPADKLDSYNMVACGCSALSNWKRGWLRTVGVVLGLAASLGLCQFAGDLRPGPATGTTRLKVTKGQASCGGLEVDDSY